MLQLLLKKKKKKTLVGNKNVVETINKIPQNRNKAEEIKRVMSFFFVDKTWNELGILIWVSN